DLRRGLAVARVNRATSWTASQASALLNGRAPHARAGDRPVLDELAVQHHEQDGAEKGEEEARRRTEEKSGEDASDQRAADPDRGRHPDRHRIGPWHGEAGKSADD